MKLFRKSVLTVVLISLAGVVSAETPMPIPRGPMPFSAFDQNGDGAISQQEFDALHARRLQASNRQGYAARQYCDPPRFGDFDRNGDGSLSADEFAQGQMNHMQQRRQQMWGSGQGGNLSQSPGMGRGMGRGMGPGRGSGMGPGRGRGMPAFSEFDLNADGALQQQEFEQARAQRIRERAEQGYLMRNLQNAPPFSTIDANGDGLVSPAEFAAAQAAHRQP